ncbi:hypothetical protein SELMODRAFT_114146 [Selaginella moellendorffii]|uniref:etheroleic acid synthase n=1 Tax=Selaginella moellendorffii TaxID=88036 RepID=D8SDD7_SELML|nr:allene oxide synthase, chloroplastic [Selaginella moellendorffii]EFJ17495.1 hypothetical protein SELMODRAFT_114146 [Selaginella moellendorffii]|eukprot:XP_002981307.1 allene oxide synthase, chloroplastic [Selaginella moellendorffii]
MEVPGSYGVPWLSAIKDKLDFHYIQGEVEFFKSRVKKYKSTVLKVNFIPTPPGFPNPAGIALLDQRSFPVLFDNSKVDKRDVFVGSYKPSDAFTGGVRTLAYLDTEEEKHARLKEFVFQILKSTGPRFLSEFEAEMASALAGVEAEMESGTKNSIAVSSKLLDLAFNFMVKAVTGGADPSSQFGSYGPLLMQLWIGVQFAPISPRTQLPAVIEELLLRSFPLPPLIVRWPYDRIAGFFRDNATALIDMGEKQFGLDREEALHNLVFVVGVNGFLGFSRMLPSLLFYVASQSEAFQQRLGGEIRGAMGDDGSARKFMAAVERMPLLKSTVLEVMRIAPPVLYQYGRARREFVVESGDGREFLIRKGELLGGSQALVCRDPTVFDSPDEFVPDRFLGAQGRELERCVFWSNGRNTDSTSSANKQCGGKDFVETIGRLFVAQLYLRYESIKLGPDSKPESPVIKSLRKISVATRTGNKVSA